MSATIRKAYLLLILIGICWGITPLAARASVREPVALALDRALACAVILTGAVLYNRHRFQLSRQMLITGIWGALGTTLFCFGATLTAPTRVAAIYYLYPIMGLGVEFVRQRRVRRDELLLALLGLGGIILLGASGSGSGNLVGDFAALGSAVTWLMFSYSLNKIKPGEKIPAIAIGQWMAVGILLPLTVASRSAIIPETHGGVAWMVVFGLSSSAPLYMWGKALETVSISTAGVVTMLEAPLGMFLCWLILGIGATPREIVGAAMILLASGISTWRGERLEVED